MLTLFPNPPSFRSRGPASGAYPIEAVVLARGSQRRMDPTRGLPESLLRTSLDVALRGVALPHRVVVHNVEGLAPGLYRWPELPDPARPGAMRAELYREIGRGSCRERVKISVVSV